MQKLYEITYIDYAVQNDKKLVVESTPIKKGKKFAPKLESTGVKALLVMRKIAKEIRMKNLTLQK